MKCITSLNSVSGQTWKTQEFVLNDGPIIDGLNLGVVLVDEITSTIFIFYQVCGHYVQCNISTQYYIKSMDDGITWTQPYNVSKQIGTKVFAGGPGYGIQVSIMTIFSSTCDF